MNLFPTRASAPCNQCRGKQHLGIFPRSEGEKAPNRGAQYGCMERDGEGVKGCMEIIMALWGGRHVYVWVDLWEELFPMEPVKQHQCFHYIFVSPSSMRQKKDISKCSTKEKCLRNLRW